MDSFIIPLWDLGQMLSISLGLLAILDFGWSYHTQARYFALHGLWNIIISILIIPDLYVVITDPLHAVSSGSGFNKWPAIMGISLHIWHCVAYTGLTSDDYFHHIVFAGGLSVITLLWDWGYSTNFLIFFICGLPGGLDYIMLALVKHNYLAKITEKRINKFLNVWMRGPGCIASACLIWTNWMSGSTSHIPISIKLVTILLAVTNGQYYSRRVVESCALHEDKLVRENSREQLIINEINNNNNNNNNTKQTEQIYLCYNCNNKYESAVKLIDHRRDIHGIISPIQSVHY